MAAACMSLMGSKKASSIAAIGVIVVLLMGLCHVQEADAAAIAVINVSGVPVNVTATVNTTNLGSVVVGVKANVSLPLQLALNTSANALINLNITNLLDLASVPTLVYANANTALVITPAPLISTKVTVTLGTLVEGVLSLLAIIANSL